MHALTCTLLALVVILAIDETQGQFGGGGFGNQGFGNQRGVNSAVRGQRGVNARNRNLANNQQALNAQQRRQNRLNNNNLRRANLGQRQRLNDADRLQRRNNINAQTFTNQANNNDVAASSNRDQANSLQIAINKQDSFSENADFRASNGNVFNTGTNLAANNELFDESIRQRDQALNADVLSQDQLQAANLADNSINANVLANQQQESLFNNNNQFFNNNNNRNNFFNQGQFGQFGGISGGFFG